MSISRFISEILEDHFHAKSSKTVRKDLQNTIFSLEEQNKKLRAENVNLSKQVERLNRLVERYEEQITQLKQGVWLQNNKYDVERKYEQKLTDLLKKHKFIREEDLLDLLHISPKDNNAIKAIMNQLESLQDYGITKLYKGGYHWHQ
jgi:predicted RNase H-like nuclease (RuvC/YqgF family)